MATRPVTAQRPSLRLLFSVSSRLAMRGRSGARERGGCTATPGSADGASAGPAGSGFSGASGCTPGAVSGACSAGPATGLSASGASDFCSAIGCSMTGGVTTGGSTGCGSSGATRQNPLRCAGSRHRVRGSPAGFPLLPRADRCCATAVPAPPAHADRSPDASPDHDPEAWRWRAREGDSNRPWAFAAQPSNGFFMRIVSSRSGLVERSVTGAPINSSMRRTYFTASAGRSAQERAPAVEPDQPGMIS